MKEQVRELLAEALRVQSDLAEDEGVAEAVAMAAKAVAAALRRGNRIFLCGNGGSAADSQHVAAELMGRFYRERAGMPAVALTTDTSVLTSVGNDYGFAEVFRRQVEGLGREGDVLIAYSTSGNAENVLRAVEEAKSRGMLVVAMTGQAGGRLAPCADIAVRAPSTVTARIQECHAVLGHVLCELVESAVAGGEEEPDDARDAPGEHIA
jgi:D-sedoheptulose 7-phosphate isomerase